MALHKIETLGIKRLDVDPGAEPEMAMIDIENLRYDDAYTRTMGRAQNEHAQKMAVDFSYEKFLAIFVAPLPRGKFAIVDGNVRVHAGCIAGVTRFPAVIMKLSKTQQAKSYGAINGVRISTDHLSLYKAALAAKEPWALRCAKIIQDAGCVLMTYNPSTSAKKPGQIFAVATVRDFIEKGQADYLTAVLSGLLESRYSETGTYYGGNMLKCFTRAAIASRMNSAQAMTAFLNKTDIEKLIAKIQSHVESPEYYTMSFNYLFRRELESLMITFYLNNRKKFAGLRAV